MEVFRTLLEYVGSVYSAALISYCPGNSVHMCGVGLERACMRARLTEGCVAVCGECGRVQTFPRAANWRRESI